MQQPWRPTAEERVKLREAILRDHPELAANESAINAMIDRAIEFARKWEPHFFPGDDSAS